jgi:hypothetical protein
MLELFKDPDGNLIISTDAKDEREFADECAEVFEGYLSDNSLIENKELITLTVDICCAYRGYKNDVTVRKQFIAGERFPVAADRVAVYGEPVAAEAKE